MLYGKKLRNISDHFHHWFLLSCIRQTITNLCACSSSLWYLVRPFVYTSYGSNLTVLHVLLTLSINILNFIVLMHRIYRDYELLIRFTRLDQRRSSCRESRPLSDLYQRGSIMCDWLLSFFFFQIERL